LPVYEYACVDCGRHMEVKQSFSDEPLKVCTYCGGKLRRVFHPVGVLFKGTGFYSTDHRKEHTKPKSKSEDAAKSGDGAAKKEGKAESQSKESAKPAAKATEKSD
jgi:putative FmdB family regulatory protein